MTTKAKTDVRPGRRAAPVWIASATILLLLLAGCSKNPDLSAQVHKSFDGVRESVRKEARDPARADALLSVVDSVEQRALVLVRAVREENALLIRQFADHSVDEAALLASFRETELHRARLRNELLESRGRLRSVATPEEWSAIAHGEAKAINELAALARGR